MLVELEPVQCLTGFQASAHPADQRVLDRDEDTGRTPQPCQIRPLVSAMVPRTMRSRKRRKLKSKL